MATKTQSLNTLKKGDYFKMVTPFKCIIKISDDKKTISHVNVPEKISKTVYVYDGWNKYGRCWNYHPFNNASSGDIHTKNKNKLVTTDFEF